MLTKCYKCNGRGYHYKLKGKKQYPVYCKVCNGTGKYENGVNWWNTFINWLIDVLFG